MTSFNKSLLIIGIIFTFFVGRQYEKYTGFVSQGESMVKNMQNVANQSSKLFIEFDERIKSLEALQHKV